MEQVLKNFFLFLASNKFFNQAAKKYGLRFGARRFVAGETLEAALAVIKELNKSGMAVTIDHLGEFVAQEEEAEQMARECLAALEAMDREQVDANLSLKLTSMGLDIAKELCLNNMRRILSTAKKHNNFVRIDMEDFAHLEDTLEIFYRIPAEQIVGQKIKLFFHPEDLMVLKILETKETVTSLYHRPRAETHVLINATPVLDEQGNILGAISVEQDISQLVRLNEELTETSMALDVLKTEVNREKGDPFNLIKGQSRAIRNCIELARKVAVTDATVLISGESGVGKEVFARAIHSASLRRENNFIPINCGAIPPALFESELFGYAAGAFTGAAKQGKEGKLELANEGTLFLDEIGELPLDMQVKLLRALQEQVFYPVGGTSAKQVNVRIIAATNRDLEQRVEEGLFREDLYYRLNVVHLPLPSLRERREDIPELISIFLQEYANKYQKPLPTLDSNVLNLCLQYDWPGNIRQVKNVMERITILSGTKITASDLPEFIRHSTVVPQVEQTPSTQSLQEEKELLEKERIQKALQETYGNKSAAARKLGISRAGLYQKLKKWNL